MAEVKSDFKTVHESSKTKVEISNQLKLIRINGMVYHFDFFNALGVGGIKHNVPFVIRKRENETVTIVECSGLSDKRKIEMIKLIKS